MQSLIKLFKVNDRNTRTRSEICSKLTIKKSKRRQWRRSGVFIIIYYLTLNIFHTLLDSASIVNFNQVNAGWDIDYPWQLMQFPVKILFT